MNPDQLKQAVARAACDWLLPQLRRNAVVGIGTGSTANCFIDLLAEHRDAFGGAVASSKASAQRLAEHGIALVDLNRVDAMDFYIDGADECNARLEMIKGGGAALTQEKIIAAVAQTFVCIADQSKWVDSLGRFPLPVEVIPMARTHVARQLLELGGEPVYREGTVTDNGCHILDVHNLQIDEPRALETHINQITGVVTCGLFARRPGDLLFLGNERGVSQIEPKH